MDSMTFDELSDGQFEEFTYDLLGALGFVNLNWRRGTGRGGASADQGRDVVGQLHQKDVDGAERFETWFVQCKHYERGVPPETLQSAVAWATAERPDVLLFVLSNFLSNPAKAWLEKFEQNNKGTFRIKVWERKDLELLVSSRATLITKYHLNVTSSIQNIHPAHLRYASEPVINSLDFFFKTLDSLEPSIRSDIFNFAFMSIINPRYRKSSTGGEKMADLAVDKLDYATFRQRCEKFVDDRLGEEFLVQGVVNQALTWGCRFADPSQLPTTRLRHKDAISYFTQRIREETDEKKLAALKGALSFAEKMLANLPDRHRRAVECYKILCEDVLPRLESEDALSRTRRSPAHT